MSVSFYQYSQLVLAARRGQEMTGSGVPTPVTLPPDPGQNVAGTVFLNSAAVLFNNQYLVLA